MGIAIACAALFLAVPLAATAAAYASGRDRGQRNIAPLAPVGIAAAFAHEWLATAALLAALPWRLSRGTPSAARRGVAVFIPEVHCSSAAFWYLRRKLRAAGWESVAGLDRADRLDGTAAVSALDARIAALSSATALIIVGHGMGGRLALDYAARRPGLDIRHVVTHGTPHGSSSALPYSVLGAGGSAPSAAPDPRIDLIALHSEFDAWLQPLDAAYCPGGFSIAVRGVGHCAMLLSHRVAELMIENLTAGRSRTV